MVNVSEEEYRNFLDRQRIRSSTSRNNAGNIRNNRSTSSRNYRDYDLDRNWFSSVQDIRDRSASRSWLARVFEYFDAWLTGRSYKFYCFGTVACSCVAVLALVTIILLLIHHFKAVPQDDSFVPLENHSLRLGPYAHVSNNNREACLLDCKRRPSCVTVLFDPQHGHQRCAWYAFSLFYLDLRPFTKEGATIYVHRRSLATGELQEDGSYYWMTSAAFSAAKVEMQCELNTDFYFLAMEKPETRKILTESLLPKLRKRAGSDAKVILWRVHEVGQNASFLAKTYIRVGDSVEYIGAEDEGHGLCQGDPFNKEGHAPLKRITIHGPETIFQDY